MCRVGVDLVQNVPVVKVDFFFLFLPSSDGSGKPFESHIKSHPEPEFKSEKVAEQEQGNIEHKLKGHISVQDIFPDEQVIVAC